MSIRLKLSIMFLAVALIPIFFIGALTFNNYKNSLEANSLSYLRNVAAFKADKIETYLDSLKTAMAMIRNTYVIKKNLPILSRLAHDPANPDFISAQKIIDEVLPKSSSILGGPAIMLASPDGRIVYSSDPEHCQKNYLNSLSDTGQKVFTEGREKICFSDIFEQGNKPAMLVTGPVSDFNGAYIGVIAFELDMASIYRIIQDVTGLGKTGEILVGKKTGNEVLFLTPLRHDPAAALKRRVRLGDATSVPIQKAVQGQNGVGQLIDYRGNKVIAAWRYLPELGWGMVAKIDAHEALADVINLRHLLILIMAIISVLAAIMAFSLAQAISGPIGVLSKGARILGSGNLDYKIETDLRDEIGRLAGSFNAMARDLKTTSTARDAERRRLYDVLETLPVYVVLLTKDYHVSFANRFFRERFGESHGKRCYEYLFNRNEPCENCETFKVFKTGTPHHWEWTGPDGRNYDIYDYPFADTDGSRMILEMGIDITEQKRAQESLLSTSLYARSLIEVSLDPLVTIASDGKITDVNDATIKVTGIPREQLIGTDFSNYFTEPEKAREGYQQVFARGFVTDYPLTIRRKDGHLTDVLYNASVYRDTRGNVLGVFAAARDVTLLKQASQYARSLIEASPDPLVTISASGKITDVNDATIKVTGIPREQLIGTDFSNYFTEPEKAREGYQQVFARGFVTDYPLTIRRKDGHLTDVLYNASVYRDTRGNVLGVFAAARDVTLLKQAEAELRRHRDNLDALVKERTSELETSNKELARSNENLEQFAYVASHDLQEPLRIMASYSELLERRYKKRLDADADQFIDYIVDAAKRMQKLITDLLAYSRVGRADVLLREVNCNSVLGRVIYSMGPAIEESGAVITHDALPKLMANESSLIQLFQNFIGNAIKFRGENEPLIHIGCKRQDAEWLFSVRDNGIGIEDKYQERIFLIFQRLHGREKYPGTGIGLAICKKIIELHGGRIWVESELGKGATFYFTLPARGEERRTRDEETRDERMKDDGKQDK